MSSNVIQQTRQSGAIGFWVATATLAMSLALFFSWMHHKSPQLEQSFDASPRVFANPPAKELKLLEAKVVSRTNTIAGDVSEFTTQALEIDRAKPGTSSSSHNGVTIVQESLLDPLLPASFEPPHVEVATQAEASMEQILDTAEQVAESGNATLAGTVTDHNANTVAVAEPGREPVAELVSEAVAEPVAALAGEVVTEPVAELVSEAVAEPVAALAGEVVTEPVAELAGEVVKEPVAELAGEMVTEPVAELAGEMVTEPVAELAGEMVTEPVAELAGEVDTESVAELSGEVVTEPVTGFASNAVTEPVSEFASDSVTEVVAELAGEAVTELDNESVIESLVEPDKESISQSGVQPDKGEWVVLPTESLDHSASAAVSESRLIPANDQNPESMTSLLIAENAYEPLDVDFWNFDSLVNEPKERQQLALLQLQQLDGSAIEQSIRKNTLEITRDPDLLPELDAIRSLIDDARIIDTRIYEEVIEPQPVDRVETLESLKIRSAEIRFPVGSKEISDQMELVLRDIFDIFTNYDDTRIVVSVITHETDDSRLDLRLSQERGRAIIARGVSRGIDFSRFSLEASIGDGTADMSHSVSINALPSTDKP
ncbi:MAG: hypothetical protein AB8B87_05785 [Granulosicoccus sp.]